MVNGTLLNFGKRYEDDLRAVAKVALRFGCAKQSKNLERYLLNISFVSFGVGLLRPVNPNEAPDTGWQH